MTCTRPIRGPWALLVLLSGFPACALFAAGSTSPVPRPEGSSPGAACPRTHDKPVVARNAATGKTAAT